ncbi:MAG: hypothetical protein H7328_08670 [Bdellovibrio sp.]|nr:hypothetical protein [Bdellovibrio sp.]
MKYEFGSIEITSPVMKTILDGIQQQTPEQIFVVVGDAGSGKSFMAEHIKKTVFKSKVVEFFDNAEEVSKICKPAIYTVQTQNWLQIKNQFNLNNCHVIAMPALQERKADLPQLAQFFLQVLGLMNDQPAFKLTEKALEMICQYEWAGNFHEFESVLENALKIAIEDGAKGLIEPSHLNLNLNVKTLDFSVGMKLDEIERKYILQTLYFVHQNRTKAADILGISIRTLRNKINQYREEGYL